LILDGVSVDFTIGTVFRSRKIRVLDSIALDIYEGETLGVVGESGSGKTTLGKTAAGLIRPSTGKVIYKGTDVWSIKGDEWRIFRREVQMIHQDPYSSLNPAHTVRTILTRPIVKHRIARGSDAEELAIKLLRRVGLTPPEDFLDKYPHQLSGGQRQRVAIARAISMKPRLIIADEPVSMIDVSLRAGILRLLAELREELRMSLLYITHDLATLRYIGAKGRTAVMYLGKLVELAPTEELIEKPLHPYTQLLLEALPEPDPRVTRSKRLKELKELDIPSIANPPPGCRFHTRCPLAIKGVCDMIVPEMKEVSRDHFVACHLY
jgi:oligopeptide/dipeptide ABC transporter ATP-binding protein